MNTSKRSKGRKFAVDVLKLLEAPMRSPAPSYRNLDGLHADRDAVTWYWRVTAVASSIMILGGYLMLPATYVDPSTLRVNQTAIGIFGLAILAAGYSFSALLTFTIRNPLFQADAIHQPCGLASAVGLLNVFYHFIVSNTYTWKTSTLLLAIAAGLSTLIYAGLFLLSHRRITSIRSHQQPVQTSTHPYPLTSPSRTSFAAPSTTSYDPAASTLNSHASTSYQPQGYYTNYIRNMYPTSTSPAPSPDPNPPPISEDEMQRQQMLMLLLANDAPPSSSSTPQQQQQSTFHIDWQEQEQDESPAGQQRAGGSRWGAALRPWDGVWRGVARREDQREERRREIEMGGVRR